MTNERNSYFDSPTFQSLLKSYEKMQKSEKKGYMDSEDMLDIAEYYIMGNKMEKAWQAIEYDLLLHPHETEPLLMKARMYIGEGHLNEAQKTADAITETNRYEVLLLKAEISIRKGKKEEACIWLREVMKDENSLDEDTWADLTGLLFDNDCHKEAESYLEKGLKHFPGNKELLMLLGEHHVTQGEQDKAIEIYNRVLDEDPYCTEAWEELGTIYFERNDYANAIECLELELAADSSELYARLLLAHSYYSSGNYPAAKKNYKQLYEAHPKMTDAAFFYAMCLSTLREYSEAIRIFKKAEPLLDKGSEKWNQMQLNLALCYARYGKARMALNVLSGALKVSPLMSDLWILKGHVHLELQEAAEATECFSKAMDCSDRTPDEVLFMMGVSLLECHFVEVAYSTFLKLLKYEEVDKSTIYPYLAFCSYLMKKSTLAKWVKTAFDVDAYKLFEVFHKEYDKEMDSTAFLRWLTSIEEEEEEKEKSS